MAGSTGGFLDGVKVEAYRPPTLPPKAVKKREKRLQRANATKQHFRFNVPEYAADTAKTANLSRPKPKQRDRILRREQPPADAKKPTGRPKCGPDREIETALVYEYNANTHEYKKVTKVVATSPIAGASPEPKPKEPEEPTALEMDEEEDLLSSLVAKFTDSHTDAHGLQRKGSFFFHGNSAIVPEPPRPPPEYHDMTQEVPLFRIRAPPEPTQQQLQLEQQQREEQRRQQQRRRPHQTAQEIGGDVPEGDRPMIRRIRPRGATVTVDANAIAEEAEEEGEEERSKPRRPHQPSGSRQQRPRPKFRGASSSRQQPKRQQRSSQQQRPPPQKLVVQQQSSPPHTHPTPAPSVVGSVGADSTLPSARSETESLSPGGGGGSRVPPPPASSVISAASGGSPRSVTRSVTHTLLSVDDRTLRDELRDKIEFDYSLDALATSQQAVADIEARVETMGKNKYKDLRKLNAKWEKLTADVEKSGLMRETVSSVQRKNLRPPPGMVRQAVARCERRRAHSQKEARRKKQKQRKHQVEVQALPPAAAAAKRSAAAQRHAAAHSGDFAMVNAMLKVSRPDNSDLSPRWRPNYERPVGAPMRWYDSSQLYSFAHHPAPPMGSRGRMFNDNGRRRVLQLSEEERAEVAILEKFAKPPAIATHCGAIRGLPNMWQSGAAID